MDVSLSAQPERGVLRWGGLAGALGGLLFLVVFAVVGVLVGPEPAAPEGSIARFPAIRAARTLENGLYLVVLVLWVAHYLALYRALRATSLAAALFGSALGVLGVVVLAAGALPHAASLPISNLYHAPGATPADQQMLVLLWQTTQGIFNALLVVGLVILPFGLVGLGMAMFGAPAFGKGLGGISVVLGLIGIGAAVALLVDPLSPVAVVGVLTLIGFHLVLGVKVFRLSRVGPGPRSRSD